MTTKKLLKEIIAMCQFDHKAECSKPMHNKEIADVERKEVYSALIVINKKEYYIDITRFLELK
jgi:hypothetical protein